MTKSQKIWLAVGVGLAVVIGVALWRAGVACSTPRIRSALKIGDAAGCYEFWFNRYQSALGGLLAIAGAFIAGRYAMRAARLAAEPVSRQLEISERQTALLALPMLREMIAAEVGEETKRKQIEDNLTKVRQFNSRIAAGDRSFINELHLQNSMTLPFLTATEEYLKHFRQHPRGTEADATRMDVVTYSRATKELLTGLSAAVNERRRMAMPEEAFNSFVSNYLVRMSSHDQLLTRALFVAHTTSEERRVRAAEEIGRATRLALS